jgi:hypothetical protein
MVQEGAEREAALARLLTPHQLNRLRQISRQVRGVFAFSDPDVAAALSLTSPQKQAVRAAQAQFYNFARHGPHGPGGPGGPDGPGGFHGPGPDHAPDDHDRPGPGAKSSQPQQQMCDSVDRLLALLTPEQADAWRALTGPKFAGNASFPFFAGDHEPHGPPPHDHEWSPGSDPRD